MDVASLIPLLDIGQSINIQRSDGEEAYAIGSTTYRCLAARSRNLVSQLVTTSVSLKYRPSPRGSHNQRGRREEVRVRGMV